MDKDRRRIIPLKDLRQGGFAPEDLSYTGRYPSTPKAEGVHRRIFRRIDGIGRWRKRLSGIPGRPSTGLVPDGDSGSTQSIQYIYTNPLRREKGQVPMELVVGGEVITIYVDPDPRYDRKAKNVVSGVGTARGMRAARLERKKEKGGRKKARRRR